MHRPAGSGSAASAARLRAPVVALTARRHVDLLRVIAAACRMSV
ncbi:MAG TPA: hypothetical protein VJ831_13825 [Jatrophihabitantaceae bacterium]|nr:hypothetical protein [Jatrophihabitantaceae bacterium]